jgi:SAM-dependent methyltransferase
MTAFKDHFSCHASGYAAYRPTYPLELVDYLASLCPGTNLALDCGCGTGQMAVLLADRFEQVVATDASAQQIENAEPHERVVYRVAPAERSGLADVSVDLVVAAQAAHWFDRPAFYAEARRVGRRGGVVALVTYGVMRADETINPVIHDFYTNIIRPYWPPERRYVEEGYRSFDFPFEEVQAPPLAIRVSWTLDGLIGYVDTWSAVRGAERALGRSPVEDFGRDLGAIWGNPAAQRGVLFPLSLRVGRIPR